MTSPLVVWAALITAFGALVGVFFTARANRRNGLALAAYQTQTSESLESIKAVHKRHLDRSQISDQMRADLRLRLFQDDERRVAAVMQVFRHCFDQACESIHLFLEGTDEGGVKGQALVRQLSATLLCRGLLLPEPLIDSVRTSEKAIRHLAATVGDLEQEAEYYNLLRGVSESLEGLELAAARWRDHTVQQLLDER